jgi:hypothetical protein
MRCHVMLHAIWMLNVFPVLPTLSLCASWCVPFVPRPLSQSVSVRGGGRARARADAVFFVSFHFHFVILII